MPVVKRGPANFDSVAQADIDKYDYRRDKKLPWKTAAAAFVLTFLGTILLCIGLPIWLNADDSEKERERGLAMMILGGISKSDKLVSTRTQLTLSIVQHSFQEASTATSFMVLGASGRGIAMTRFHPTMIDDLQS
jgi:hypothetical protein